jgi:6-phosphogluconolactonase/glucosamine-6-phosphate isomerase/deaminase
MKIEVFTGVNSVARQAARDRFVMAVSGGHTPWIMLSALAQEVIPWAKIRIAQVDERVLPAGHFERNLTRLRGGLLDYAPLPSKQIYARRKYPNHFHGRYYRAVRSVWLERPPNGSGE